MFFRLLSDRLSWAKDVDLLFAPESGKTLSFVFPVAWIQWDELHTQSVDHLRLGPRFIIVHDQTACNHAVRELEAERVLVFAWKRLSVRPIRDDFFQPEDLTLAKVFFP